MEKLPERVSTSRMRDEGPRLAAEVPELPGARATISVLAAFFLSGFGARLLSTSVLPLFGEMFVNARNVSDATFVLCYLALSLAALRRPRLVRERLLSACSAIGIVLGLAFVMAGVSMETPALLAVGAVALSMGCSWENVVALGACCSLSFRYVVVGVPSALGVGYAVAFAVQDVSVGVAFVLTAASCVGALLLARPHVRQTLDEIGASAPVSEASMLSPASYVPLSGTLFVCMFLFSMATGFSLNFGGAEGSVPGLPVCAVIMGGLALWGATARDDRRYDVLFSLTVVVTVGGLFLISGTSHGWLTLVLLMAGSSFTTALLDYVLVAVAKRNRLALLFVCAWGLTASSGGMLVGTNLSTLANVAGQLDDVYLLVSCVGILLLAYVQLGMREYSFARTILGIEPDRPLERVEPATYVDLDAGCALVAGRCGLTPRETEVLGLLARGHNGAHIQEQLVLAHSTVKSYIKHIYAKLGVHSQQELIDMVLAAAGE